MIYTSSLDVETCLLVELITAAKSAYREVCCALLGHTDIIFVRVNRRMDSRERRQRSMEVQRLDPVGHDQRDV